VAGPGRDNCREYVESVVRPGVTLRTWNRCAGCVQVHFYRIRGGRRAWPRGGPDASHVMWDFFRQYRLR
jgi:poly(3-hydroxybutyrate) depolymerase